MRAPSGCSSSSGSPAAAGAAAAGASAGEAQRLGRLCRRADAAGGARHRAGGRPARGHHRRFHTPLARPAAATCLGQLHLGPAPTAALWKLLLRVVPPLGPAPPRRQRASFPLHALGASDARPDPVTVAVKAVTGQRVNDMVTTRSKAKHEAPQGAAAPQGAPLPHALTSCTARREPGRAVRFSPSRHRPPTKFEHDDLRRCSVSFFTPSRGAGAPDCTERTPHRPLPGPSMPQAPVRPPGERRRSLRLRDQVHDTPGVHKSKNKPRRARWSSYTDSDGDHHPSEEY